MCGVSFVLFLVSINSFPMEGLFFSFKTYLLGWFILLQLLLKKQNSDFKFCQKNVLPDKLFSFSVEATWKISLKTYMEKVVSRAVSKAYFVNFCKVLWHLNTATYLFFTDWSFLHNWSRFLCEAYAQTRRWLWWECEREETWPEYGINPAAFEAYRSVQR